MLIGSTLLDGQVPFAGACLGTTAYYVFKTEGSTLEEAKSLEDDIFGETTLGVVSNRTEFDLISFISSHFGLRNLWLGIDVEVNTRLADSGEVVLDIQFDFPENTYDFLEFFKFYDDFGFDINGSDVIFELGAIGSSLDIIENITLNNITFNNITLNITEDSIDLDGALVITNPYLYYDVDVRSFETFVVVETPNATIEPWEFIEEDKKVDGFFHIDRRSTICLNENEISADDLFIVTSQDSTIVDAANVCTGDAEFSSITSEAEFNALANALIFHRDFRNIQPFSRYLLNMNFNAQLVDVDSNTSFITNLEEIINLQPGLSSIGLNSFIEFDFELLEGINNTRISFVLEYHFGEVSLNIIPSNEVDERQFDGFLCRRNTPAPTPYPTRRPPTRSTPIFFDNSSNNTFPRPIAFLFVGLGILIAVFGLVVYRKIPKRKPRVYKLDHNAPPVVYEGPTIDNALVTILGDNEQFSLSSGRRNVQYKASEGDFKSMFSAQTNHTHSEDKDLINYSKVNSVITKHTNYSQVSEMMLQINDLSKIKGATRKKSFSQRVATILKDNLSDDFNQADATLHKFDAETEPTIPLEFYILRIMDGVNFWYEPSDVEDATVGIRSLLLALHFLRKMTEDLGFIKNSLNIHKTLSILVLLAAKFIEDKPFSNSYWASVSGITLEEVSELEDLFCFSLGFEFSIDQESLGISLKPYEQFSL